MSDSSSSPGIHRLPFWPNMPQQKKVEVPALPIIVNVENNIQPFEVEENKILNSILPEEPPPLPLSEPPPLPLHGPPLLNEVCEEGIVNLPRRPDESHLDAFVLDKIKIWKNKRFSSQYILLTYKDKIEKSILLAFLRKYCNGWLIETDIFELDEYGNEVGIASFGIRIAHEFICKDGVYRPHTHVYLEFKGRMPKTSERKEFFKIFGVEAPDIRLIGERREAVISYLMKEDTEIEPIVVLGDDGKSEIQYVDAIPEFPVGKLGEKWQRTLWDFLVKKVWDENIINYVVERKNGRDRNDFINSFDDAYNILVIDEKTINDDTLLAKKLDDGLGSVRALTRQKDAIRYVIVDMVNIPDEGCLKRIKNLQSGKSRGGKGKKNDGFGPPRVLVFSRKSIGMKIGVRRVNNGGIMWNIAGSKIVDVESDFFKDSEWNLGVVYEDGVYKVLDWQLRRLHTDWEEDEFKEEEKDREERKVTEQDDKAKSVFYKMMKNMKWASYQIAKEDEEGVNTIKGNIVNPFAVKPELKIPENNTKYYPKIKPNEYLANIKERWSGYIKEGGWEVDS